MSNLVRVSAGGGVAPTEPIAFHYTGGTQSYNVPKKGTYQLEVWGASGTSLGYPSYAGGGLGGYAKGNVVLERNQVLYICVGGQGSGNSGGYNGGANGDRWDSPLSPDNTYANGAGGGATHIGKTNSILQNTSQANVYIAAGGGGGAMAFYHFGEIVKNGGGSGGGATGGDGAGGASGNGGRPNNGYYGYGQYPSGAGGLWGGRTNGGGCGHIGGVTDGSMQNGVRSGNGYARITYLGR